ncbi:MAG: hypothetical protein QXE64_01295 [Candidatus Pacearchaeota archaeon]
MNASIKAEDLEKRLLNEFEELALAYHAGSYRKDGKPFIEHPRNVCNYLSGISESYVARASALLHDTIEEKIKSINDGNAFWQELIEFAFRLYEPYKRLNLLDEKHKRDYNFILQLVYRLTKQPGQTYFDYLYNLFYDKKGINKLSEKIKNEIMKNEIKHRIKEIGQEATVNAIQDFLEYKFDSRDKNIIVMRSIEIKLADMLDNIKSLPTPLEVEGEKKSPFNVQSALYSFYKGLLLANEVKTKIKGLKREKRFYKKVQALSRKLIESINERATAWISYFEEIISLPQESIDQNYELVSNYEKIGGFERATFPSSNYLDGTWMRYGKILLGQAEKERLGLNLESYEKEFELRAHIDLLGFKKFAEKMKNPKFKLTPRIYNLEKMIKKWQ